MSLRLLQVRSTGEHESCAGNALLLRLGVDEEPIAVQKDDEYSLIPRRKSSKLSYVPILR
jgi:hypothetical protein